MRRLSLVILSFCAVAPLAASDADTLVPVGDLDVDFRNPSWQPSHFLDSFTVGNVTASTPVADGFIRGLSWVNNLNGSVPLDGNDGLGVLVDRSGAPPPDLTFEDYEINDNEILIVDFEIPIILEQILLTDLYHLVPGNNLPFFNLADGLQEAASITLYFNNVQLGAPTIALGDDIGQLNPNKESIHNGEVLVTFGANPTVDRIVFSNGAGVGDAFDRSNFSVGGINGLVVPEPVTMISIASGLALSAAARRRKAS